MDSYTTTADSDLYASGTGDVTYVHGYNERTTNINFGSQPSEPVPDFRVTKFYKFGEALGLIQRVPMVMGKERVGVLARAEHPAFAGRARGWSGFNFRRVA